VKSLSADAQKEFYHSMGQYEDIRSSPEAKVRVEGGDEGAKVIHVVLEDFR
jgi:hypothetical protein